MDFKNVVEVEGTRSGPYHVGDTMDNGTKILALSKHFSEYLYPTGVRRLIELRKTSTIEKFIYPDGTEASPGDMITLFEDKVPFQVPYPKVYFTSFPKMIMKWIMRRMRILT